MDENKIVDNANEIKEIVMLNPMGEELPLKRITDGNLNSPQKYKEVFVSDLSLLSGNLTQASLQVANQGMTLAQIAQQAPNGLFTATANPVSLSKFANGTTSTMVRDASGHLVGHAGFSEVGLSVAINPAIILSVGMQVMSAMSGTYYLNKIHAQIAAVDSKLEELLNIHHDTNIGRLIAARKGLSEISNREHVDFVDINTIRNYKKTTDEIYEEYMYRLKRQEDELVSKKDIEAEKQILKDINFSMTIAFEANKLSMFAELIEIGTRWKIGGQTEIIKSLSDQLKQNYENSFYHNIEEKIGEVYSIRQQKSDSDLSNKKKKSEEVYHDLFDFHLHNGWGIFAEIGFKALVVMKSKRNITKAKVKVELENENLSNVKEEMKQNKELDGIDLIIDEVIKLPYQNKEILYIPIESGNRQRVFVPVE